MKWKRKLFSIISNEFQFILKSISKRIFQIILKIFSIHSCFFHFSALKLVKINLKHRIFLHNPIEKIVLYSMICHTWTRFLKTSRISIRIEKKNILLFVENNIWQTNERKEKRMKTKTCRKWESIASIYKYPCTIIVNFI